MALGSLSSAKINKKILFFQENTLFYLFIVSNFLVHHIMILRVDAFFWEMKTCIPPPSFRQIIKQIGISAEPYRLAVLVSQLISFPVNLHFPRAIGY